MLVVPRRFRVMDLADGQSDNGAQTKEAAADNAKTLRRETVARLKRDRLDSAQFLALGREELEAVL